MALDSFFHILNPSAKNRSVVARLFKKYPEWRHVWVDRSSHPTHIETIVEWAQVENQKQLAVWSGDGTFGRVVNKLYEQDSLDAVDLALIPAGTCNDFLRKMKRASLKEWVTGLDGSHCAAQSVDVGLIEWNGQKRVFINNAGFGRTQDALQKKKSNPLQDIARFTEKKIQVEWGTDKVRQYETIRSISGLIFNAPYFSGGLHFDASIKADDGLLSAFFVQPQNKAALLGRFIQGRMGRPLQRPDDVRLEAQFLRLESEQDLFFQADGDAVSTEGLRHLRVSVLPNLLKLTIIL